MSIQLALLKSGEEVIADIKELRDSDNELVSYYFGDPHVVKIKTNKLLVEEKKDRKLTLFIINGCLYPAKLILW